MPKSPRNRINVPDPRMLKEALTQAVSALYTVFETAREHELRPVENGVTRYCPENGKTGFQVSGQYERAGDFCQTLMDMLRVQYEPEWIGTFFLNANIGFLLGAMPEIPFQLGYATRISREHQDFHSFWEEDVLPHVEDLGYSLQTAASIFVVVSTGQDRFDMEMVTAVLSAVGGGFTVDDVMTSFSDALQGEAAPDLPPMEAHSGFVLDPALGSRFRISLWLFSSSDAIRLQ